MNLLTGAFSALLSQSVTALPVMAVVVLARILLARVPGKYRYVLWAAVGFRLLCPVALASPVSLFNLSSMEPVAQRTVQSAGAGLTAVEYDVPAAAERLGNLAASQVTGTASAAPGLSALELSALIWLTGLLAIAVYAAVSDIRLRRRLRTAVVLEGNVYEAEGIPTAFVLGIARPRIYLPFGVPEEERAYILLHEKAHLSRGDPWWKLLAFLLLAVYWWNPTVWMCFVLFCRDMECSCDEAVLRRLGPEVKQAYGRTLVSFAAGRRFPAAAPLAFGEGDAKHRVLGVLRWKQTRPRVAFAAAVACVFLVLSLCTNAFVTGSYIKYERSNNAFPVQIGYDYTYYFDKDVQSLRAVLDVYDAGTPVTTVQLFSVPVGISDSKKSVVKLSPSGTVYVGEAMNFDTGSLSWYFKGNALGTNVGTNLPEHHYSSATMSALGKDNKKRISLPVDGDTIVMAAYISYAPDGSIHNVPCETLNEDITQGFQKNVVLAVVRLTASSQNSIDEPSAQTVPAISWQAKTLYSLRNPYVGNNSADSALLSAVMGEELGDYTVELFTSQEPYALQVNLKETQDDPNAADQTMENHAFVLLALIDNLGEVRWTWPEDDGSTHTDSCTQQDADAALSLSSSTILQGRTGIKDFSGSPQDVQDLLNFLN